MGRFRLLSGARPRPPDLVNALRRQGLEISRADAPFKAGAADVAAGDYVIRADQPYRTMAEM